MWAVIWHDTHTDAEVYLFDSQAEAEAGAIVFLIDYLRGYPLWDDRLAYADLLESIEPDVAFMLDWYRDQYLDGDLTNLYCHVTEAQIGNVDYNPD